LSNGIKIKLGNTTEQTPAVQHTSVHSRVTESGIAAAGQHLKYQWMTHLIPTMTNMVIRDVNHDKHITAAQQLQQACMTITTQI